jgi:hypothetical protein
MSRVATVHKATFTIAEFRRFMRAARAEGFAVAVEKRPDGSERLLTTRASESPDNEGANEWDEVLAP